MTSDFEALGDTADQPQAHVCAAPAAFTRRAPEAIRIVEHDLRMVFEMRKPDCTDRMACMKNVAIIGVLCVM